MGGNLIYKYKSRNLVEAYDDWIDFFKLQIFKEVKKVKIDAKNYDDLENELTEISKFCKNKLNGLLNPSVSSNAIEAEFNYDIIKWIDSADNTKHLNEFKNDHLSSTRIKFEFTDNQIKTREDIFKRYGSDINALSKIVTRISNLEGQFRKIKVDDNNYLRDIYSDVEQNFVKYALSN